VICADNTGIFRASHVLPTFLVAGERTKAQDLKKFQIREKASFVVRPEDFVWLELSMVKEVERVFVERRGDAFQVIIVVNDRSPELRKRIFARERSIIDELSHYEFDFDILTRLNHDLNDLVGTTDKPSYARV
jgi:hypothetical protein